MARIVVNRGLQVIADRASAITPVPNAIQTMAIDDSATAFAAGDTTLGNPTNVVDRAFSPAPTRSGQTVTHSATFDTTVSMNPIRRISLHNESTAVVTGTSATLVAGIDAQSLVKTTDFSLTVTVRLTYTSA